MTKQAEQRAQAFEDNDDAHGHVVFTRFHNQSCLRFIEDLSTSPQCHCQVLDSIADYAEIIIIIIIIIFIITIGTPFTVNDNSAIGQHPDRS